MFKSVVVKILEFTTCTNVFKFYIYVYISYSTTLERDYLSQNTLKGDNTMFIIWHRYMGNKYLR